MSVPEKPCPWHAETINSDTGRLGSLYCEIGPAGHDGLHIGNRSRQEFLRLLRAWRRGERKRTREEIMVPNLQQQKGEHGPTE